MSRLLADYALAELNQTAGIAGEPSGRHRLSQEAHTSYLQGAIKEATATFTDNQNIQKEVSHYGAGFLTTAALFMPGRIGLAGSVVLGALDHASPNSSGREQLADLALGGLKGAGMRTIMHAMGSEKLPTFIAQSPALKGVAFGFSNRTLDTALTRQNYLDSNGNLDGATFGANVMRNVVNPTALISDAATFVVAHGLITGATRFKPALFEGNKVAQTVAMSSSFGLSNGATAEIIRQQDAHEDFNLGKVLGRSVVQGVIDGFAGVPGGMRSSSISRSTQPSERYPAAAQIAEFSENMPGVPGELHSSFARTADSSHINLHGGKDSVTRFVQVESTKPGETVERVIGPNERVIEKLTIPERSMEVQPARVTGYKSVVENIAERSNVEGPFPNFDDFYSRGLVKVPTDVRKYSISGHKVEVVLPERYASRLDDAAAKKPTPEGAEDYSNRVGPADLPPLLDAMPNSGYFKRIFISDKQNPEDAWVSQGGYNKNFISAMSMTEGELNMYKTARTDYLRRDVLHEWSHELRYEYWDHNLTYRFADGIRLESKEWNPSTYAGRNNGEQWAVLGERMIGNDAKAFIDAAEHAPIRTVIWMRALKKCLDSVPAENKSVDHDLYVARQKYVDQQTLPVAIDKLNQFVKTGTAEQQTQASNILKFFQEEGLIK